MTDEPGGEVLALIPARKGSKGLPGKNTLPLAGKPLIAWTIECALAASELDYILVSSDDEAVIAIAEAYGVQAPFIRPADLSTDDASSVDVALHALRYCSESANITFSYLVLLEPTSPLRTPQDIDSVISKLVNARGRLDAVVTVGRSRHSPALLKTMRGPLLESACPNFEETGRRQTDRAAYFPFGVAYAISVEALANQRTFYPARTGWYELQRHQEFEVDDILDHICVEAVMRNL